MTTPPSGKQGETFNYNHISHTHCWNQNGNPPCGIPMEKHTQCCLCDLKVPENSTWKEEFNAMKVSNGRVFDTLNQEQKDFFFEEMNDIKYFIEDLLQKERTRTIAEVMGLVESIKPIVGWNTEHIGRNELLKDLNSLK